MLSTPSVAATGGNCPGANVGFGLWKILRPVLQRGMRELLAWPGLLAGLAGALAATRIFEALADPATFVAATGTPIVAGPTQRTANHERAENPEPEP